MILSWQYANIIAPKKLKSETTLVHAHWIRETLPVIRIEGQGWAGRRKIVVWVATSSTSGTVFILL